MEGLQPWKLLRINHAQPIMHGKVSIACRCSLGPASCALASVVRRGVQVRVGDCEEALEHLHSGELAGNRFVLAIRNVSAQPPAVRRALAALRDRGFLNYFGMQR